MMSLTNRKAPAPDGGPHAVAYDGQGQRVGEVWQGVVRAVTGRRAGEVVQGRVYDAHGGRVGEVIAGHLYDSWGQHQGRVASDGQVYDSHGLPLGAVRMSHWDQDVAGATALLLLLNAEAKLRVA